MKYRDQLIILGEGEKCEPALMNALLNTLYAQTPQEKPVISLSLGGCCGNVNDITNADNVLSDSINQCIVDPSRIRKKVIVMDYDDMERRNPRCYGQAEKQLRTAAEQRGYELKIQRPNLEYTICALLTSPGVAADVSDVKKYVQLINEKIDELNIALRHQFGSLAFQIPHYGKKGRMAELCLNELFNFFPEFIDKLATMDMNVDESHYSDIPSLVQDIKRYT